MRGAGVALGVGFATRTGFAVTVGFAVAAGVARGSAGASEGSESGAALAGAAGTGAGVGVVAVGSAVAPGDARRRGADAGAEPGFGEATAGVAGVGEAAVVGGAGRAEQAASARASDSKTRREGYTVPRDSRKLHPHPTRKASARVASNVRPMLLSVVVPMYNEEHNVAPLLARLVPVLRNAVGEDGYEIVLVNDGSSDGTLASMREAVESHAHIVVIDLSRNFGHQLAATAGIELAQGEAVTLMDGDLQDPPELIAEFLARYRDGYDVVYAVRRTRKGESFFKLLTARLFYRIIKRLTKVSIPVDTGDFRLMSRRVVEALRRSPERHRFLRGMVSWVGYRQIGVEYDRDERLSGVTKYPFTKMMRFAIDGITSFSDVPLRFVSYFGFFTSAAAIVYALVVVGFKLFSLHPPGYTRGWASTIVAVLFLGGVQLIGIGIVGEYIGRIYDEVKGRPLYLIRSVDRSGEKRSEP